MRKSNPCICIMSGTKNKEKSRCPKRYQSGRQKPKHSPTWEMRMKAELAQQKQWVHPDPTNYLRLLTERLRTWMHPMIADLMEAAAETKMLKEISKRKIRAQTPTDLGDENEGRISPAEAMIADVMEAAAETKMLKEISKRKTRAQTPTDLGDENEDRISPAEAMIADLMEVDAGQSSTETASTEGDDGAPVAKKPRSEVTQYPDKPGRATRQTSQAKQIQNILDLLMEIKNDIRRVFEAMTTAFRTTNDLIERLHDMVMDYLTKIGVVEMRIQVLEEIRRDEAIQAMQTTRKPL